MRKSDMSILSYLEKDARTPYSQIARKMHRSQQQVSYRIKSLREKGVLKGFDTLIDYSKMGVLHFRVYFKISYTKEKTFDQVITYLRKHSHTSWIQNCGGSFDLVCTFFAQNPSQFNKVLKSIMETFQRQLRNYTVLTTVVERHFGRKYLNDAQYEEVFIGGDRKPVQINEENMLILSLIARNARKSSVKIANKLGVTPKTVINHMKKLEKDDIILGYKPQLHVENMDYISRLILVKFHNISSDILDQLVFYLRAHPSVVGITKTLGEWDMEIEVEAKDVHDFRKTERALREKFSTLIQDIQTIPLYKIYKKNYFPQFLLDN